MKGKEHFTLQPVMMEYLTRRLIEQAYEEFRERSSMGAREERGRESRWADYAFLKAQAKEYIQAIQKRLILHPLAEQLLSLAGEKQITQQLMNQLAIQHQQQAGHRNYLAGNVLNMLIDLHANLRGANFSSLTI